MDGFEQGAGFPYEENAELSYEERAVCRYIDEHTAEDDYYDAEIAGEEAFDVHFHLSSLRHGFLNWYDFKRDASLLELGADFGGLTGFFCEQCAQVTAVEESPLRVEALKKRFRFHKNLKIVVGDWHRMDFDGQFDYVVVYDLTECDEAVLNRLAGLLKPDGRLLVSFENCFGLKYICGMPERHTGRLFDGLSGYAVKKNRYSFSRGEVAKAAENSVFTGYKFFYLLPDDRLPQLIYTDGYLPGKNLTERLMPYYEESDTLLCRENDLYGEVTEQGAFPFFSNSFLVEYSKDGQNCDVAYAAVSTDRPRERAFVTTIYESGTVFKKPLFPEGKRSVEKILENTKDLEKHGIPVVPHSREDGKVSLPFVSYPTLADYLREKVPSDSSVFIKVLKDLYAFILQSSEQADPSENAIISRMREHFGQDAELLKRMEGVSWGPVMKKAYLELITLNCFYREETEEYLFFDQEFVRENYPADYVLFRTIAISYAFIPELKKYVPLQQVKDAFSMNETWEFYQREENLFMDEIRLLEQYRQLRRWTNPKVEGNYIRKLECSAKCKREDQIILFGTGKRFDNFCERHRKDFPHIFAVDNDSAKWGQEKNGIKICPPEEILKVPGQSRRVLICCADPRPIEEQLKRMKVKEFWNSEDLL